MGARPPRRGGAALTDASDEDDDDEAALARKRSVELELRAPPAGLATTEGTRLEVGSMFAGLMTCTAGLTALLGVPLLALPLVAAGVGLVALGSDARLLWSPRRAAIGGLGFGTAAAILGAWMSAPAAALAIPVAGAAAGAASGVLRLRDRQLLRALVHARERGEPLVEHVDALITRARPVVFECGVLLANWQRFDLLERLGTYAMVPGNDSLRRYHLALARLGRGDPESAMAIAGSADHGANGPGVAQEWILLVARIRIARGEAADVIAEVPRTVPGVTGLVAARRLIVLADAHAAVGDVGVARALIGEVAAAHGGRELLEVLRDSRRPSAPIAAGMLAETGPYR
jgi:hypothetical protein